MRYYKLHIDGCVGFYTYKDEYDEYEIGQQVNVIFSGKRRIGIIVYLDNNSDFNFKVNKILSPADNEIILDKKMINLLIWTSNYYLASFSGLLKIAIPKNMNVSYQKFITFGKKDFNIMDQLENSIYEYLTKKEKSTKITLCKHFGKENIEKFLKNHKLKEHKVIKEKNIDKDIKDIKLKEFSDRKLSTEQQEAYEKIINSNIPYNLLYGVTGSGKTEVYIELIKKAILKDEGVIFLLPEISLTPQMIKRFSNEFGENIAILHSKLSLKERAEQWYSLYSGEKKICIGVRSAIFAQVKNLKYIIVDEEHETTYKQDNNPRYSAKAVALKRVELEDAKLILGSATPSIESYYFAKKGMFNLIKMDNRYGGAKLPEIKIVDMKKESSDILSEVLLAEISNRIRKNEQIILLLNRKGYSTFIQCKDCGDTNECPHCSVTMNYYKSSNSFRCNYCGYSYSATNSCKSCGSNNLFYSGKGTEKIEKTLEEIFTGIRVLRVDNDIIKSEDDYKYAYEKFLNHEYDIIIGTQMIAKGFHFPNVTLVGVITADSILHFPDFRAGEKTFQLITQASGRAGRGEKEGEVLIQTYNQENYVIEKIKKFDYESLYHEEIENRKILGYPPFNKTINIVLSCSDKKKLERMANQLYNHINYKNISLFGPMDAPIAKVKNRFRKHIFIKGEKKEIHKYKKILVKEVGNFKDNDFRITIDVDPINLM